MGKTAIFLLLGLAYAYVVIGLGRVSEVYFDARQYFDYARNLLETGVYGTTPGVPDMNREPGYGLYLTILFSLVRGAGLAPTIASLLEPAHLFWVKFLQAYTLYLTVGLCAFRGALPSALRRPLFALALFSPTFWGASRELFSEALSIPLALVLLFFLSHALVGRRIALPGLAVAQAAVILTKAYLQYLSPLFLIAAFAAFLHSRRGTPLGRTLLALAIGGFAAQYGWKMRNSPLVAAGEGETRLSIALVGKVARLDTAQWPNDLAPAFAAALGTNFCDGRFGAVSCERFDYRGCDRLANEQVTKYRALLGKDTLVDKALKHDMAKLYFHRPFTQLFGSGLELLRIFFFESVLDAGTLPGPLPVIARLWHIVGSLLLWALAALGIWGLACHWPRVPRSTRELAVVCAGILAYHAVTMSQITNVVRYVFPVVPLIYLFAAAGAARLISRGKGSPWLT